MRNFRNSRFGKVTIWVMFLCITLSSCDPKRHLVNEMLMQKQAEKVAEFYALSGVDMDCEKVQFYLSRAKNYVLSNNSQGHLTTREELISFLSQQAVSYGDLSASEVTANNLSQVNTLAEYSRFVTNGSSIEPMVKALVDQSTLTQSDGSFLMGLQTKLSTDSNNDPSATLEILDDKLTELSANASISESHKQAISQSINVTKSLLCGSGSANLLSGDNSSGTNYSEGQTASSRCEIIECMTTYEWVLAIVYVVVTVILFILAIFTFGLSLLFTTIIAVAVWTLATVVTCWIINCDDPLCPEGKTPKCQGNFILDEAGRRCINPNLPSNAFIFQGCVLSPRPSNGICPSGSTGQGQNCLWECFFPEPANFGVGSDGKIQFDYTCQ